MPTTHDSIADVLAASPRPLAPADVLAELERRGVETTVDYVYQVLNQMKRDGRAVQPRRGRWALVGPRASGSRRPEAAVEPEAAPPLRWPAAPPADASGGVVMETCDEDGRVIYRVVTRVEQVGDPIRTYVRTRAASDGSGPSRPTEEGAAA